MDLLTDPGIRTVAIVRLRVGLGDLICSLPAWRALRRARPDLRITVITWKEMKPLLDRMHQYVDELLPFPGHAGIPERPPQPANWPGFLRAARERGFDLAIQAYGDRVAANDVTGLLGARHIGGFAAADWTPHRDPAAHLSYPRDTHEVHRHLRLVAHLGLPLPPHADALEFPLTRRDAREFECLAASVPLPTGRYAVLHPGASATTRRWPAEQYAQVADGLAARGLQVVIAGVASERSIAEQVVRHMRAEAVILNGRTSIGGYAMLLRHAALLVCNDTGAAHLAAAVSTPTVVIFLSGDPVRWAHDLPTHRLARVDVGCNPCGHLTCPIDFRCATRLPADDVLALTDQLLG
jgi:ADP-heptose:LPS heptosyltransferase